MSFDLNSYLGLWYEIARTPNMFERSCSLASAIATAEYNQIDDKTIDVINTCYASDGSLINTVKGKGKIVTGSRLETLLMKVGIPVIAALRVSFGGLSLFNKLQFNNNFANYFIIWLSPPVNNSSQYQRAIVFGPPNLIWFLSRTPTVTDTEYEEMLSHTPSPFR
jgi:apolipoprotein D and lipocalin family protein